MVVIAHRFRSLFAAALLAAVIGVGGCDSSAPLGLDPASSPEAGAFIVSESFPGVASIGAVGSRGAANVGSSGPIAWVSAPPGWVPDAESGEVANLRLGVIVAVSVAAGGFDPVAVPAAEDDSLEIRMRSPSGLVTARAVVPARRRPRVVRTQPSRGRTDVALNSVIGATFSEPVNPATVGDSTVRLLRGGVPVAGTIRLLGGSSLSLEFIPAAPLDPATTYRLVLDDRIRDFAGDPLERLEPVEFTTFAGGGTGTLVVTARTSGEDPDGYVVRLDGGGGTPIGINSSLTIADAGAGRHVVRLDDVSPGCVVAGGVVRDVTVTPGVTAPIAFEVSCAAPPTLTVSVTTLGPDPDTDGYDVLVDGSFAGHVPPNGSLSFQAEPGEHELTIAGVRGNCWQAELENIGVLLSVASMVTLSRTVQCTPDFVPNGVLAFAQSEGEGSSIWIANADGTGRVRLTDGWNDRSPTWSPDGSRIAFQRASTDGSDIYLVNADGSGLRPLVVGVGNMSPSWSPDGSRIAFANSGTGAFLLHTIDPDAPGAMPVRIGFETGWNGEPAWSPSGEEIAFVARANGENVRALYVMRGDGTGIRRISYENPFHGSGNEYFHPAWAPDGLSLVVSKCDYGAWGPPPAACFDGLMRISADGQTETRLLDAPLALAPFGSWVYRPSWSPDGTTIAFSDCCRGIRYTRPDGQQSSVVIEGATDPAWRP